MPRPEPPPSTRSRIFGEVAEQYDRARPSYPAALVDELVSGDVRRVLDVGCGTGIASQLFIVRGCAVIGVEPDVRMAAVARRHGVDVDVATFEEWEPRGHPFDLVIAAQSWHWVGPSIGVPRTASALRPGGRLACFWNMPMYDDADALRIHDVYTRHAPHLADEAQGFRSAVPEMRHVEAIDASGSFHPATTRAFERRVRHTVDEWIDQLATTSGHLLLDDKVRSALFRALADLLGECGGTITMRYTTSLIVATRR